MTITPKQYAKARGISLEAVSKQLRKNKLPPKVESFTKYSRFYVLKVKKDFFSTVKD